MYSQNQSRADISSFNVELENNSLEIINSLRRGRCKATSKAYESKQQEFVDWANTKACPPGTHETVTEQKLLLF